MVIVSGNGDPTTAFTISKKGAEFVAEPAWQNADIPMRMSNPVLVGDTLYVTSSHGSKNVFAVNAKTGEPRWRYSPEVPAGIAFVLMAVFLGLGTGATFAWVAQLAPPAKVGTVTGIVGAEAPTLLVLE